MDPTMVVTPSFGRMPLAALGKLTVGALGWSVLRTGLAFFTLRMRGAPTVVEASVAV